MTPTKKYTVATGLVLAVSACATPMPDYVEMPKPKLAISPLPAPQAPTESGASSTVSSSGVITGSIRPIAAPAAAPVLHIKAIAPAVQIKPIPAPVVKAVPTWTLSAGHTVGQDLQAWGAKAGWQVIWNMPKDWSVPSTSSFGGEFADAASEVIKTLADNGALIRAQFYEGNRTLVITGPGVASQ